jgi:hypothetical protein
VAEKRPLTPAQPTLRGRSAAYALHARHDPRLTTAVRLASLSLPQRRLVSALLEAAKAASAGAVATDTKVDALAAGVPVDRREPLP